MRATVIGLAGALIAIVIGVALMPEVVREIDTLENVIGDGGNCVVVSNRYEAEIVIGAAMDDAARFGVIPNTVRARPGDPRIGSSYGLGDLFTSAGLPPGSSCEGDTDTVLDPIQAADSVWYDNTTADKSGVNCSTQTGGCGIQPTVIAYATAIASGTPGEPDNLFVPALTTGFTASIDNTYESQYVGIIYDAGEARKYSGVMLALVTLMPLLIIVGIIAFIVFKFGLGSAGGLSIGGGGNRRRR